MDLSTKIYLDYAATTPVDERVVEAMLPYFSRDFGNPSSVHGFGQQAEAALENARERIASVLQTSASEIVFTSCGTESDNLALRGAVLSQRTQRGANHLLITPVEHHAVGHTAEQLARYYGFELEYLPIDQYGCVDPQDVKARIRPDTALVSVIYANNEIGTINPVDEIGVVCREHGVLFHTDAVQAAAHLPINLEAAQIDLLAIGAHKFYGPKGVGALFIRKGSNLVPSQTGGAQEYGMRAGTQNIPYIVGMAEALRLARLERSERSGKLIPMRDRLIGQVLEEIPGVRLTGHPERRLPNHASFVFEGVDGNTLSMMLDGAGFACSSGSACKTGNPEPSGVLLALGLSPAWALGSLRVTLGKGTTPQEVDQFLSVLPGVVERVRALQG
ncbi:MAG: cysteine desulfurase [Chloroflexi bacterium]|nr:cysteine desulfurase [Chloroflexota bacterium]